MQFSIFGESRILKFEEKLWFIITIISYEKCCMINVFMDINIDTIVVNLVLFHKLIRYTKKQSNLQVWNRMEGVKYKNI